MKSTLVIASANQHKIDEMNAILADSHFEVKGMRDLGIHDDIIEDGSTLEENALIKARYLYQLLGKNVFAEDTGLEVYALDMEPGVITARYAGPQRDAIDNMNLLLNRIQDFSDRRARFRTVIALIYDGVSYLFEGKVEGHIAPQMSGDGGFGYDPIFIPEEHKETFATLPHAIKNGISHRRRAIDKLITFLNNLHNTHQ